MFAGGEALESYALRSASSVLAALAKRTPSIGPFQITKTSGSTVISGAINGESALTIRTTRRAADSRYARLRDVMRQSEATRPQLRPLGDQTAAQTSSQAPNSPGVSSIGPNTGGFC